MNAFASGGTGGTSNDGPTAGVYTSPVSLRSFVVRAFLESGAGTEPTWLGVVTDTRSGDRHVWRRTSDIVWFLDRQLAADTGARLSTGRTTVGHLMAAPTFTDVVTDMLTELGNRLPPHAPGLPVHNVTLEHVKRRLVGLGNHRGQEPTGSLGSRSLSGGRLDARIRFQLWGSSAVDVDTAVLNLHSGLLDDADDLRTAGFLTMAVAETTLADPIESVTGWRKATSYDVLYEFRYVDSDDADSLISQIPVTIDPERSGGPAREQEIIVDEMVRWDSETAPPLEIRGPATVRRLSALVYQPGPGVGGDVVLLRSTSPLVPPLHQPDLATFFEVVGGDPPAQTDADVTLAPADLFAGLGASGSVLELGDWDVDGVTDSYVGFARDLVDPIILPTRADRFTVSYTPPPGPLTGLDQTAVVYLRANAP